MLPGVANIAGNPPGARQGRGETWRCGAGWGSIRSGGRLLAGLGEGFPDVLLAYILDNDNPQWGGLYREITGRNEWVTTDMGNSVQLGGKADVVSTKGGA